MKKIFLSCLIFPLLQECMAQNVGIGTTSPVNKLQVMGSMVIAETVASTTTPPTPAQTITMSKSGSILLNVNDSTGRIYDTGGPNADYLSNSNFTVSFYPNAAKIEVKIEDFLLGPGDYLRMGDQNNFIIFDEDDVGFGTYLFDASSTFAIKFESDGIGSNPRGFSLFWRYVYTPGTDKGVSLAAGNSLFFDVKTGAFGAGSMGAMQPGNYSVAIGNRVSANGGNAIAIGNHAMANPGSTAIGRSCKALGQGSIALGNHAFAKGNNSVSLSNFEAIANGHGSTAFGSRTNAFGTNSTAMGNSTIAGGQESTAMGTDTYAAGFQSTSMGYKTNAAGDNSTAMGSGTEANGESSTAMGFNSVARGYVSTSMGYGTGSNGYAGTALGMFNDPIVSGQTVVTSNTPLFIIGNGNSVAARTNAMVVLKNGNTGIGSNTPPVKLQIAGGTEASFTNSSGFLVLGDVTSTNLVFDNNEIMARNNGNIADLHLQAGGGKVMVGSETADNFLFKVNGTAGKPGGGSWSAFSDGRLKKVVQEYTDGLTSLVKINPVWYQYNELSGYDTKPKHVGVIAQELQKVAPYMVSASDQHLKGISSDYLQVDNSAMIYMLINAVKEQQKQLDDQQQLIAGIRKQLEATQVQKSNPAK